MLYEENTTSNNVEGFALVLETIGADIDKYQWYVEKMMRDLGYPAVYPSKIEDRAKETEELLISFLSSFNSLISLLEQEERAHRAEKEELGK